MCLPLSFSSFIPSFSFFSPSFVIGNDTNGRPEKKKEEEGEKEESGAHHFRRGGKGGDADSKVSFFFLFSFFHLSPLCKGKPTVVACPTVFSGGSS